MTTTVIVPAALLPPGGDPDPYAGLALPGLTRLLDGTNVEKLARGPLGALADAPGIDRNGADALAAFAARGEPLVPSPAAGVDGWWMFATPIRAALGTVDVSLAGAHEGLPAEESDALLASLSALFASDGLSFHRGCETGQWYARSAEPQQLVTRPLPEFAGGTMRDSLPAGGDAPRFRRYLSEIEMLLHADPVNDTREARGEARVDGVWMWGSGTIAGAVPVPTSIAGTLARPVPVATSGGASGRAARGSTEGEPTPIVFADDPLVRAIARGCGHEVRRLAECAPRQAGVAPGDDVVVFDDALRRAFVHGGLPAWSDAFTELDRRRLVDLARLAHVAGDAGRAARVAVVLGGATHAVRAVPRRRSWLRRVIAGPPPAVASLVAPLREPG